MSWRLTQAGDLLIMVAYVDDVLPCCCCVVLVQQVVPPAARWWPTQQLRAPNKQSEPSSGHSSKRPGSRWGSGAGFTTIFLCNTMQFWADCLLAFWDGSPATACIAMWQGLPIRTTCCSHLQHPDVLVPGNSTEQQPS